MVFQFDFNDTFEGGLADGTYEAVISAISEDATQGGTKFINCVLTVRNDVEQKGKNALIFHRIWMAKATGKYNKSMLNTIGKYAQMDENKKYQSLEDVFEDLSGKPVRVTVKNEESEYNGNTYKNLNVKRWDYTKFPNVQHQFKKKEGSPFETSQEAAVISEDDLPF